MSTKQQEIDEKIIQDLDFFLNLEDVKTAEELDLATEEWIEKSEEEERP